MEVKDKIFVAGHKGLVGSATIKKLMEIGFTNLVVADKKTLDLRNQESVYRFFQIEKPKYVFICAGKVGGISANINYPANFIYDNMMIQSNVIEASRLFGVKKLLALGSSCIYPKNSEQPIKEEYLMNGVLEPTNEYYAISKIFALKLCDAYRKQYGCDYISAMPTNLYGDNDNYDLENSHVLPALIRKVVEAKNKNQDVTIWGSGLVRREFLFSEDCADACIFLMKNYSDFGHVNVGTGRDIELNEVLDMIISILDFKGNVIHDTTKPEGMKVKRLDVTKLKNLGWSYKTSLYDGLKKTIDNLPKYEWYQNLVK